MLGDECNTERISIENTADLQEYRHPSCLVKHRWEHSPHWKEPTQLSMSKHQQVQMLEVKQLNLYVSRF